MHTIPILGADADSDVESLSHGALPAGARITARQAGHGVHMDPATLALIVDASKEVLVAAITMLGSIWAARIAARGSGGDASKHPDAAMSPAAIEIDTLTDSHLVLIDDRFEQQIRAALPDRVEAVLNIRLRRPAGR